MEKEAREMVEEFGLQKSCKILGWVDEKEKNRILSESKVFILPSRNEGLPMSLLEAMSYGLAPIVTPVGGIPDTVFEGENGTFVNPGDVKSIARKLEELIEQEDLTERLGKNARESVYRLGIEKYGPRLESIWNEASEK